MAHIVCIVGKADCGKSYLAKRLVAQAPRLVVIDTTGEWAAHGAPAKGYRACLERLEALARLRPPTYRLVCQLPAEQAQGVLAAVWALQPDPAARDGQGDPRYKFALVIEEADMVSTHAGERDTPLAWLCNYGKRCTDPCLMLARRCGRLIRDATANADRIVFFESTEPADLEDARRRGGKELEAKVRALSGHQYVIA